MCKELGITIHKLRQLIEDLGIKNISETREKKYSMKDRARLKAGIEYKDYKFVEDYERPWIFHAFYQGTNEFAEQEITIEV